jgi:hypothetical protein
MKRLTLALIILLLSNITFAQQYSLYNTGTLFDSFENPSQRAFQPDSSRQFAFNFFIPSLGFNAALGGPATSTVRSLIFDDAVSSSDLVLGRNKTSRAFAHMNTYLLMLRMYTSVRKNKELGVSWQLRSDNQATVTNESIAIFDSFNLFEQSSLSGIFNDKGYSQNYHQISLTFGQDLQYRKDYDRVIGVGLKLSYLSGIAYNDIKITSSTLAIDKAADNFNLDLKGKIRRTFVNEDEIGKKTFLPSFKNPGLGFSASFNTHLPKGWYILGNLKDIGFIKWNKKSYVHNLDRNITIENASADDADNRLDDELDIDYVYTQKGFITPTNGKAEFLINKNMGFYQPNLLLSKNIFYAGGDVALMNNFSYNKLNFSLSTVYNTSKILQVGSQFMVKSPNTEFYIGSDQLYKSIQEIKALSRDDKTLFHGYPGTSFYIGFAAKFGYIIEQEPTANRIAHFNTPSSFFERLLAKIGIRL